MKKFILLLVIVFFSFLHVRHFFGSQFPVTHDGQNHLFRFANYYLAAREGQLPPRFAPGLLNRYGYPVFNYNYPLANILSLPFSYLKIHPETTLKILMTSFVVIGLLGMYRFLESLQLRFPARLFGMSVFASSPFLFSSILYRGNIGEVMALSLLPWVCSSVVSISKQQKISLISVATFTAFSLSHNLTVVGSIPLVLGLAVLLFKSSKPAWLLFFANGILSVMLSLWFWLPAIWEQSEVVVGSASLVKNFDQHFVAFSQLLFSPITFGFSYPGSVDSLSFQLGFSQILVLVLAGYWIFKRLLSLKKINSRSIFLYFYLVAVATSVGTLLFTKVVWNLFPFLQILQFPWRLELFFVFAISIIATYIWNAIHGPTRVILIIVLIAQVITLWRLKPVDSFHYDLSYYQSAGHSSSTQNENLPKTFTYTDIADWQPTAQIINGNGGVQIYSWRGSEHVYQVSAESPVTIVEPTMYFLGWKTFIDNSPNATEYQFDGQTKGRIAFHLEPGNHHIISKFTQQTPARLIGNLAFPLGFVVLLTLFIRKKLSW